MSSSTQEFMRADRIVSEFRERSIAGGKSTHTYVLYLPRHPAIELEKLPAVVLVLRVRRQRLSPDSAVRELAKKPHPVVLCLPSSRGAARFETAERSREVQHKTKKVRSDSQKCRRRCGERSSKLQLVVTFSLDREPWRRRLFIYLR